MSVNQLRINSTVCMALATVLCLMKCFNQLQVEWFVVGAPLILLFIYYIMYGSIYYLIIGMRFQNELNRSIRHSLEKDLKKRQEEME